VDRRLLPKHELVAQADILSVDVPLSDSTFHLVNAQLLGQLKRGSLFLNTSHGPVVDQTALVAALESRHLGGAVLDVDETAPRDEWDPAIVNSAVRASLRPV
jgi:phosphoglycerate dehydrogenase-like enzyme